MKYPDYVPSSHYTKADWDEVADNPELTAQDIADARPFVEVFKDLAVTIKRRGPQKAPTKISTTIRLSPEVLTHFHAGGPGWQARIDHALREWIARGS